MVHLHTAAHNHFLCEECGRLLDLDLDMKSIEEVNCLAGKNFDGAITSSSTLFFGKCGDCIKKS
jgi:Fe2+ or Zn2+ uptake regulation protein